MSLKMLFEYIWLDSDDEFRSKTKVMEVNTTDESELLSQLPIWNYDGSSTGQAIGKDSEVFLKPAAIFKDPFRYYLYDSNSSYLVWCETVDKNDHTFPNSSRQSALNIFNKYKEEEPWFGLEQEYFIVNPKTDYPLGFDVSSDGTIIPPVPQGKYYCGVGPKRALGRQVAELHLKYCLYAGIKICGINAEVAPGQWEYQIGPCVGIETGDHVWVSRYILDRVAEHLGYSISYHPKLLGKSENWNGSGCHSNFSTKNMREPDGINYINQSIKRLSVNHHRHMNFYGKHNTERMSGLHETSAYNVFTFGRADRSASIRIPNVVLKENKGYFEDRRPAANCDPYLVTSLILQTTMDTTLDKFTENNYELMDFVTNSGF